MAFDEIYREIAPKLHSYLTGNGCSYASACDIVQETFLRVWKRREELSDDLHQVSGLVFTIARNYRNDLARKAEHEVFSEDTEREETGESELSEEASRPGEVEEETAAVVSRLKSTLERMPGQLLEAFALSRLGSMSVKEIAEGTGASEANVKVRIHRARELFLACFKGREKAFSDAKGVEAQVVAVLKAMMMLAAVDGEIAKEELSLYRKLAEEYRGDDPEHFEAQWERCVRAMAYIGFLSEILSPEELVEAYAGEVKSALAEAGGDGAHERLIAALEEMAKADGNFSRIERDSIAALATIR